MRSILLIVLLLGLRSPSVLGNISFFDSGVDYWSEHQDQAKPPAVQPKTAPKKKFSWKEVMDPSNDEFFREGDYLPPKGFLELIRNPSDYNIQKWNEYVAMKNKLSQRLMDKFRIYGGKEKKGSQAVNTQFASLKRTQSRSSQNTKRYKLRLYFSSDCPHCKRMFKTAHTLAKQGFFIEGRQVDNGTVPPLAFPISRTTKKEIKEKKINTVPVLLIADTSAQRIYRLSGYQDPSSVYRAMNIGQ